MAHIVTKLRRKLHQCSLAAFELAQSIHQQGFPPTDQQRLEFLAAMDRLARLNWAVVRQQRRRIELEQRMHGKEVHLLDQTKALAVEVGLIPCDDEVG